MSKADYRALFKELKTYIKFNPFLKEMNINQSNFSHFLNGYNHCMSVDTLEQLHSLILDRLKIIA